MNERVSVEQQWNKYWQGRACLTATFFLKSHKHLLAIEPGLSRWNTGD